MISLVRPSAGFRFLINILIVSFMVVTALTPANTCAAAEELTFETSIVIATTNSSPMAIDKLLWLTFREIGINAEYIYPAVQEGYEMANTAKCDAIVSAYPDLDRIYTNLVKIPYEIETTRVHVFAREQSEIKVSSWDDLAGMRVGIIENRYYIVEKLPDDVTIITKPNANAVLECLERGDYDVAVLSIRIHEIINDAFNITQIGIVDQLIDYLYLHKSKQSLVPLIMNRLGQLSENEKFDRILYGLPIPIVNTKKTILYITSNNYETEREELFSTALRNHFTSDATLEWKTIALDAKRFSRDQQSSVYIANLLRADCVSRNVAAIIVSGDPAFSFLTDYYYLNFRNVPVLYFEVSDEQKIDFNDNKNQFTGIQNKPRVLETLVKALELFPNTRTVYTVNDYTVEGAWYQNEFERQLRPLKESIEVLSNENIAIESLMAQISALPPDSLVFVGSYFVDGNDQYYALSETKRFLEKNCFVPILSLYSDDIPYNAIGGKCQNFTHYGKVIAEMLDRLLSGETVRDIPPVLDDPLLNVWVFDKIQLLKFSINEKDLPPYSRVINKPLSLRESNPEYFIALIILILLSILLIITLVTSKIMGDKRNRQIKKSDSLLRAVNNAALVMLSVERDGNFETSLLSGMAQIGQCLNVDRLHIWQNMMIDGELCFFHRFEWLSEPAKTLAPIPIGMTYLYKDKPEWYHMFTNGEHINSPLSKLSLSGHAFLNAFDIKTIVIIPMFLHDTFWGFFSTDDCRRERVFSQDEIAILHSASLMMINAFNHSAMTQDIKISAAKLKDALAESNQASLAKSEFIANMSHEIRTPLNSIIGFSELALDDQISTETRDYLENIIENANWLLAVMNDILDISKIEVGKIELESIPFDLHELLKHCQKLTMYKAIEKGLLLHFYAEPTIGKKLIGDPTRLHQIFINLLSNAIKFTNVGAVKLSSFITHMGENSCTVCFQIRDSGVGMTKEQIEKIFVPFVQGDSSMTRVHGGTGLGLSIVKNLVELMGGTLNVESTPKVGSIFSFELTFQMTDAPEPETVHDTIAAVEKPTFDGTVLVCEDNPMNQRVIREHLQRVGLKVDMASNGEEGVEMVRLRQEVGIKPYDLVLMDIHMPVMDGLEAAPKIIELGTGTPIIAITANIMTDNINHYNQSGMTSCITKPFTSQELWRCLLKYLKPTDAVTFSEYAGERPNGVEDDKVFLLELMKDFVKSNRKRIPEMKNALQSGDAKLAYRIAHNLKTNAGLLKCASLQKAAFDVEEALKEEDNSLTLQQLECLEAELTLAIQSMEPLIGKYQNEKSELVTEFYSVEKALSVLAELEPLLRSGNPDALKFIDELSFIKGSDHLIECVMRLDFKPEAYTALTILKSKLEEM